MYAIRNKTEISARLQSHAHPKRPLMKSCQAYGALSMQVE